MQILVKECSFVIVGNYRSPFGRYLREKYTTEHIQFMGRIYDQEKLNNLSHVCLGYLHGHSFEGTNPSLLEAMARGALVAVHDNVFHRKV